MCLYFETRFCSGRSGAVSVIGRGSIFPLGASGEIHALDALRLLFDRLALRTSRSLR